MAAWIDIAAAQPSDGQVVYVRRLYPWTPTLFTWSATAKTFTNTAGLIMPWYECVKWRPQ